MCAKATRNRRTPSNSAFSRWKRQAQYAWSNVLNDTRKQPLAALLTIMVITVSLMLPTVGYLLWKNADSAAKQWYPTPNLTIYLDKSIDLNSTQQLLDQLNALDNINSLHYLSPEDALTEFRQWSGFNSALDMLDDNPLPAVVIITPKTEANQPETLKALQGQIYRYKGVDDVRLDDGWFARLTALTGLVGTIAAIIAVLMVIAVFLVIGNSVRLGILARQSTIQVMRLIGATDGFILRPFLYNGAALGFISALFSLVLSQLFVWRLETMVSDVSIIFGTVFVLQGLTWDEAVLLLLLSTMMGWLAAWLTTIRFLRIETAH